MSKKFLCWFLIVGIAIFFLAAGASNAWGKKPPWDDRRGGRHRRPYPDDPLPVSAPEPTTMALTGLGLAGVAGYNLIRRKRKK